MVATVTEYANQSGVGEVVRSLASYLGADGLLGRYPRHEGLDEFALQRLQE